MKMFTVYERIHEGQRMNDARDKILLALKESVLSQYDEIMVLEMIAFEKKFKAVHNKARSRT